MPSVNFYLEKRRDQYGRIKTRNVPVLMYFSYDGRRFQFNTGEKTDFEKWDFEMQKIREKVPFSEQINAYLNSLALGVMNLYREAKQTGIQPGNTYFRESLRNRKTHSGHKFFDAYIRFIEENNERWSIYTFRKIKTNYRHLRDFSENSGYQVDFDRINEDFYRKYADYFLKKGHSNSTILKNINILKWFLNWSTRKGYNRNMYYRDYRFPWEHSYKADPADLYLEWDELMALYHAELSEQLLSEVRDIFCFMCFTGLKHSQLRLLGMNIDIQNNINILQSENRKNPSVSFSKYIEEILNRYSRNIPGNKTFPDIRNAEMNRYIKDAGKIAGINRPVKIQIYKGLEKLAREVPKYKLFSTRVARNTFIYHSLRLDIPLQHILNMTGMKTLHGIRKLRKDLYIYQN
jgi:site-specific recombinase XerD